jgi:archaellum component FlaG (FlaF/FlaG flagellin family)
MSSTQSDLQVTLVKGNLSKSSYSSYSYYYAYLDFKNLGTKRKAVTISDVTIVVNGQQYDSSLSSYSKSLLSSLGNVYPGATLSKQLTFYNVPKTTSPMTMYIELKVAEDGQNQTLSYQFTYNQ